MGNAKDQPKVHFVSLGCPKNRVDSEIALAHLADATYEHTADAADADVIVVNTCGFIEDAKKESIDVIFEMAQHKADSRCQRLVVSGCLAQRYPEELAQQIPEIDHLLGAGAYGEIAEVLSKPLDPEKRIQIAAPTFIHDATTPRLNTFRPHSAYVKISEGCDQKCAFCIIPKLRGLQRSRPIKDIVREVEHLASRGVREVNLIAQDLTGYGYDQEPRTNLAELLAALDTVDIPWIRLHYAYPRPFSKALIRTIADSKRIVPYIDMPLQHISDPVLKAMRRGRPKRFVEKLLNDLRAEIPGLVLRSSFIVGFPGETDEDFQTLREWVQTQGFERVGVFKYSLEEGTSSFDLPDRVPQEIIDERHHDLMELLRDCSRNTMEDYVGRHLEVLVDGPSEETELLIAARHKGQAPEVDGTTYINDGEAQMGDIVEVEVTEALDYDLVARVTRTLSHAPRRDASPRMDAAGSLPVLQ